MMNGKIITDMIQTGPLFVNTYIVYREGGEKCVVIDPADAAKVGGYLEEKGLECSAVLLTHCHFDHILGVAELQRRGARVYISEKDEPGLRDIKINQSFRRIEPCSADVMINDGDVIEEAGLRFEVIATPGHTMGGVCFVNEQSKTVFSGDTLFRRSIGRTDLYGGSTEEILASIRGKLFTLDGDYEVCPGHGAATRLEEERSRNPYV